MDDPIMKPLKPMEREFIHFIVYQGLDRVEALSMAEEMPMNEETIPKLKKRADAMFNRPHIYAYYNAVMEEVREKELGKAVWTKEVATEKLMRLIEKAEEDLYGDPITGETGKPITMSRLNAIVLPAKELNLMHGFNQTNIQASGGCVVEIVGEEDIPD